MALNQNQLKAGSDNRLPKAINTEISHPESEKVRIVILLMYPKADAFRKPIGMKSHIFEI